ncbi:hypothetical protein [Pseudomonas sp. NPDC007930]|uniref:hypothetical protein n=1 Tax=Pseudomonas sp. NPDC007930 TaxID=3364417 RepID=UPI0036E08384
MASPFNPVTRRPVLLATILAALAPLVVGMAVSIFVIQHSLDRQNHKVADAARVYFDELFDSLAASAELARPWLDARCDSLGNDALPQVNDGVLRLVRGDCERPGGEPPQGEISTSLSLEAHDPLFTRNGALRLNWGYSDRYIQVVLDNRSITRWMKLISGDTYLTLHAGGAILWDDGALLMGDSSDTPRWVASATSERWPYQVRATLSSNDVLDTIGRELLAMLLKLCALAAICAGLCHWAMTRPRS